MNFTILVIEYKLILLVFKPSYNRELEKKLKNAEILHYAKSSTFNETSSPHVSDENLCKESNEQLRYNRELEKKNAEILHYTKSLEEQAVKHQAVLQHKDNQLQECYKRNKGLERQIEELTDSKVASSTFNETSSPHVSDDNLCKESNEQLRNQDHDLENKIKQLTESHNRELEKKNAEILHYAKSLEEQAVKHQAVLRHKENLLQECYKRLEEQAVKHQAVLRHKENQLQECYKRNKGLERQIEELTDSKVASLEEQAVKHQAVLRHKENQLQECYKRLEEQAVKHQAVLRHKENQLQECYKRNKGLERQIEELTDSKVASLNKMKAERKRMESTYKEQLKSKQKELDDCRKRFLEEQSKSFRLNQNLKHCTSRLSQEESKTKKLEDDLRHQITSYNYLQDSYNEELKQMARQRDYFEARLSKKDDELRVLQEEQEH
ncbi:uncharacterized protein LOC144667427 isoform X1 [Oculina patagonica]